MGCYETVTTCLYFHTPFEVKVAVRVKKLWNVAKKAGLSLEATQMVLRIDKPMEEEVFGNDAELLA